MAFLPLFLFAVVAVPDQTDSAAQPGFHEYHERISELLKRESQAKDERSRAAAVAVLCRLHSEIVHDSRYSTSDVLKEYRGRLWSRLTKIKNELKAQLARNRTSRAVLDTLQALESADAATVAAADALASSLSLANELQSSPVPLVGFGGAPIPPDWGPDLVDLIERTINPSFWDVVGGPGTVYYYRPLQCLVVTATAEVHGNVGGLLGGLRK
jgi:HPt (histidine-containing phosphotransfer) domain-containing protein